MLRHASPITALVVVLLVFTPGVWAGTAETWTSGIYDYEPDDATQLVVPDHVSAAPVGAIVRFEGGLAVVARLAFVDRPPAPTTAPRTSDPRGPPLS